MRELRPGVWHWHAPHPGWSADEPWEQNVSSYAIDDGERLLLFDPLAPPRELEELASERDTAVVLTNPWHERDTRSLVDRLGTPVHAPRPESAQDLMDKYGITAEQAGDGSPDLRWLLTGEAGEAHWYSPEEGAPAGIEAFAGRGPQDLVLWIDDRRTVSAATRSSTSARVWRSRSSGSARTCRASTSSRASAPCSTSRSSSCSRRTARRPTEPRSSARSPDA